MKTLHFQNTMADLVAFNLFRNENSPLLRKWMVVFRFILAATLAALALIPAWLSGSYAVMVLALPFAIYGYVNFPKIMREKQMKLMRKQLVESGAERFVDIPRALVLEEDGLLSTNAAGQSKYPYASVMQIAKSDEYVFIVANGGGGYAIPHARSTGQDTGQHAAFFADLQQRVDAAARTA